MDTVHQCTAAVVPPYSMADLLRALTMVLRRVDRASLWKVMMTFKKAHNITIIVPCFHENWRCCPTRWISPLEVNARADNSGNEGSEASGHVYYSRPSKVNHTNSTDWGIRGWTAMSFATAQKQFNKQVQRHAKSI